MSSSRCWLLGALFLAAACGAHVDTSSEDRDLSAQRGAPWDSDESAHDPSAPQATPQITARAATEVGGAEPRPSEGDILFGEPLAGSANLPSVVGSTLDSGVLDYCRQPLPGIRRASGSDTLYDESLLSSSQSFQVSGSGEWDDNANYRRFLDAVAHAPVHETVDVSNRQFVVVLDEQGRGVSNCPLELKDAEGTTARLTTQASGRAAVFPALYGLVGPVTVKARCSSRTGRATLSLESVDEVATVQLDEPRDEPQLDSVDLAFVLDVTGSMSGEIEAMKRTIDAVATEIVSAGTSRVRLALVAYRDYWDTPVFETYDLTDDLESFRSDVEGLRASGGGDRPEAVNEAMDWATRLDWDLDATARMAFVIADAPPHPDEEHSAVQAAAVLSCAGVKVFSVATTGQDATGRFIFRQMSQLSSATHLFLLREGADPGAACADYEFRTDELHTLVIERIQGELAARDSDPLDIPGLGADRDTEVAAALDECAQALSEATGEQRAPLAR